MRRYKKIVKNNLKKIVTTSQTMKDIYSVIFSHSKFTAYEILVGHQIKAVTYATLDQEIREFAGFLNEKYPAEGHPYVGIDLANSPNFLLAFWGALMSGYQPYLINSYYPTELKHKLLQRLDAKFVITDNDDYKDIPVIKMEDATKTKALGDDHWANEFSLSSTLTGLEAKMCVYDGQTVINQIMNAKEIIKTNNWLITDYNNQIKVAMVLPLFHIFGIMAGYFWFSFFGQTIVFFKDNAPDTVRATINRHKITHIFAPPVLFHKLYKGIMHALSQDPQKKKKFNLGIKIAMFFQNVFPNFGVKLSRKLFKEVLDASFGDSPRFMISGGAYIEKDALKVINCLGYPLFNGYGTTETAITGANLAKKIKRRINGSIGAPFSSVQYLFDTDQVLSVKGASICKKIISLNSEETDFDAIKTNDIVKKIKGKYYIVGRKNDLFIGENGENISPDTIQNELVVKHANRYCVLEMNAKLVIVLEYAPNTLKTLILNEVEEIKKTLSRIAYGRNINEIFVTFQEIANPNAIKASRALLRRRVSEGTVVLTDYKNLNQVDANISEDDMLALIMKVFSDTVKDDSVTVSPTSDFFVDLGGDSIEYIMLITQLEKIFNVGVNRSDTKILRTPAEFYSYLKTLI